MRSSMPSPDAGIRLKTARLRVRLSTREVERLSQKLAHEKQNQEYYISHAWLTEIETGQFTPSIYKLYSLSLIYKQSYDEILAFFGIDIRNLGIEQMSLALPRTHLLSERAHSAWERQELPDQIKSKVFLEKTNLVSRMLDKWGGLPVSLMPHIDLGSSIFGYVGMDDYTLDPIIRPGSFVQIDGTQKRIDRSDWSNQFDRPIYFVELRDGYACSWCEMKQGRLLLIPYPRAQRRVREVRFPSDAEIVGKVTAVSMQIAK